MKFILSGRYPLSDSSGLILDWKHLSIAFLNVLDQSILKTRLVVKSRFITCKFLVNLQNYPCKMIWLDKVVRSICACIFWNFLLCDIGGDVKWTRDFLHSFMVCFLNLCDFCKTVIMIQYLSSSYFIFLLFLCARHGS